MLNRTIIMGRLTRDPELRRTGTGIAVTSFTVAVDRDYGPKDGGEKQTDFFDCVAWRQTGEYIAKYFTKGRMIVVEGRLEQRHWNDKEGNKRSSIEINVDSAYFGDSKKQDGGNNAGNNGGYGYAAPPAPAGYAAPAPAAGYAAPSGGYSAPTYNAPAPAYGANSYATPPAPVTPAPAAAAPAAPVAAPAAGNGQQYNAPAPQGYAQPSYGYQPTAPASNFVMLEEDDAQLPF